MKESDFQGIPNNEADHEGPLAVSSAAVTLLSLLAASDLHQNTRAVLISIEDAAVRYTINGTTPTATLGFAAIAGQFIRLSREEADLAQFIRSTGTDSALQVAQYKG